MFSWMRGLLGYVMAVLKKSPAPHSARGIARTDMFPLEEWPSSQVPYGAWKLAPNNQRFPLQTPKKMLLDVEKPLQKPQSSSLIRHYKQHQTTTAGCFSGGFNSKNFGSLCNQTSSLWRLWMKFSINIWSHGSSCFMCFLLADIPIVSMVDG